MNHQSRSSSSLKLDQGVKIEMVSDKEMTSAERQEVFDRPMSAGAIPDLNALIANMYEILEYLYKDSTEKLMKTNESAIKMYLNNRYADSVPYGMITLLMEKDTREKNVEGLLNLFENLSRAKNGEVDLDDVGKDLSETINQRYLYEPHGSKDAFERELMKNIAKEKHQKQIDAVKGLKSGQLKMNK
jgi:hypothetical protein